MNSKTFTASSSCFLAKLCIFSTGFAFSTTYHSRVDLAPYHARRQPIISVFARISFLWAHSIMAFSSPLFSRFSLSLSKVLRIISAAAIRARRRFYELQRRLFGILFAVPSRCSSFISGNLKLSSTFYLCVWARARFYPSTRNSVSSVSMFVITIHFNNILKSSTN